MTKFRGHDQSDVAPDSNPGSNPQNTFIGFALRRQKTILILINWLDILPLQSPCHIRIGQSSTQQTSHSLNHQEFLVTLIDLRQRTHFHSVGDLRPVK